MKKFVLLIFALCVGIICGILAWQLHINIQSDSSPESSLDSHHCVLNENGVCEVEYNNQTFQIQASPFPIVALKPTIWTLSNLNLNTPTINAKIYGINMDMGTTQIQFRKTPHNTYEAKVFLGACVLESMEYRLSFEGRLLGISADFYVKNKHNQILQTLRNKE